LLKISYVDRKREVDDMFNFCFDMLLFSSIHLIFDLKEDKNPDTLKAVMEVVCDVEL